MAADDKMTPPKPRPVATRRSTQTPPQKSNPFLEIEDREKSRLERLFVEPAGFPPQPKDNLERVYLIVGSSGHGRMIAAVNWALRLVRSNTPDDDQAGGDLPIFRYQGQGERLYDLNNLISNEAFTPSGGIYIVHGLIGENGLDARSLTRESAEVYRKELRRRNAYLILTASEEQIGQVMSDFTRILIGTVDLSRVIEKHLSVFFYTQALEAPPVGIEDTTVKLIKENINHILKDSPTPKQIGLMFEDFRQHEPKNAEDIRNSIRVTMSSDVNALHRWFRGLSLNTKIFAMLNAILIANEIEPNLTDVMDVFDAFVQHARRKPALMSERQFADPRLKGIDELLAEARMVRQTNVLSFRPFVQEHIIQYEIENYPGLLWLFAELLVEQIDDTQNTASPEGTLAQKLLDSPDHPRLNFAAALNLLATVVGYVGGYSERRLSDLLDRLAEHDDYDSTYLIGAILKPLARESKRHRYLRDRFERWLYARHIDDDKSKQDSYVNEPTKYAASANGMAAIYSLLQESSTPETRKTFRRYILDMGKMVGSCDPFIRRYEAILKADMDEYLAQIAAERGSKDANQEEREKATEQIRNATRDTIFRITEWNVIELLSLIREIALDHAEQAVDLIVTWLEQGRAQLEDEDPEEDDAEVDRILALDNVLLGADAQATVKARRLRRQRSSLNNMAWHVGMMAAALLFQEARLSSADPLSSGPQLKSTRGTVYTAVVEDEDETDAEVYQPASTIPDEINGGQPSEQTIPDESHAPFADGTTAAPSVQSTPPSETPDPSAPVMSATDSVKTQRLRRRPHLNRIVVQQVGFPLLQLLKPLLRSSDIKYSVASFLRNTTRGPEVLRWLKDSHDGFYFDIPTEQLNTDPLREAFGAILTWYDVMVGSPPDELGQQKWTEVVYPVLLELCNEATEAQAQRLQVILLEQWLESPHQPVRRIAHALLARSYILNGRVPDLPSSRYGVILVDASARRYDWDAYDANAYRLIQQLATLTPLQIYPLGSTRLIKQLGQQRNDSVQLLRRELQPRHLRNRLLMPLLEATDPDGIRVLDPAHVHFILVLVPVKRLFADREREQMPDLLDLLDVLESATHTMSGVDPKLDGILTNGMYTDAEKAKARQEIDRQKSKQTWEWKHKLILLTSSRYNLKAEFQHGVLKHLVSGSALMDVEDHFTLVDVQDDTLSGDVAAIQNAISTRVAINLHNLPAKQWGTDLAAMWVGQETEFGLRPDFAFDDLEQVRAQLNVWVAQLGDVTKADHPRDVTMTILWALLTISRLPGRLPDAIELIKEWIGSEDDAHRIMGIAATKAFFNFYYLAPDGRTSADAYVPLLDLLPPFMQTDRGRNADEFSSVMSVVLFWSRDDRWSSQLCANDSPLLSAVRRIKRRSDQTILQLLIGLHESAMALAQLYVKLHEQWESFVELLNDAVTLTANPKMTQEVTSTVDTLGEAFGKYRLSPESINNLLASLRQQVEGMACEAPADLERKTCNVRNVANAIRLSMLNRVNIAMPRLTQDQRYGIILIDGQSYEEGRDLQRVVRGFVQQFREKMRDRRSCDEIILTIHRIGSTELIYSNAPTPPSIRLLGQPNHVRPSAPLITPILERYTNAAEVAFVLLVTSRMPLDLMDWSDQIEWLDRFFIRARGERNWISEFYKRLVGSRREFKRELENLTESIITFLGC